MYSTVVAYNRQRETVSEFRNMALSSIDSLIIAMVASRRLCLNIDSSVYPKRYVAVAGNQYYGHGHGSEMNGDRLAPLAAEAGRRKRNAASGARETLRGNAH